MIVTPHTITRKCPVTGELYSVTVEKQDWEKWNTRDNKLNPICHFFPYLTNEQVEFLLSGISPNGIQHLFKDSEVSDVESED